MQYEDQIQYQPLNFAEEEKWPTATLRTYMMNMILEHDVCDFPRKAQELGRVISNAHFELEYRAGVYSEPQAELIEIKA